MGYRGKFMTEHTGIELPVEFVEKYKEEYHILKCENGKYYLNVCSEFETKGHFNIISDLEDLVKDSNYNVWAVILWEDGVINRYNLSTGENERIGNGDHEF
jgi:hypothetical protein